MKLHIVTAIVDPQYYDTWYNDTQDIDTLDKNTFVIFVSISLLLAVVGYRPLLLVS
jgi:hypothetical protein